MNLLKPITKVSYLQLLLVHIGMAPIFYFSHLSARLFFLFVITFFVFRIFSNGNRNDEVLLAAAYITGFEVLSRMTGGVGISYEFAKFAVIGFMVIGMLYRGFTRKSWPYIVYILLLVPGILFSAINLNYETKFVNAISFNLSGPMCLAITALYCYNRKIGPERLQHILLAILLPIVTMTAYLFIYTPNIRDVLSGTHSNFAASGGFGPNQVATVLGLGMIILFTRLLTIRSRFVNIIDILLFAFVSYRGIITFSRGGILTAVVCCIVFLLVYYIRASKSRKSSLLPKILFIVGTIAITWVFSSVSTYGLINKRYSNQDAAGRVKKDITTGRAELLKSEIDAFYSAPITGIGVGKIREYRFEKTGILSATHNEISRVLSEHGLFGLLSLLLLIVTPLTFIRPKKPNPYILPLLFFWLLTIGHSSLRIAAPAFVYGIALLNIYNGQTRTAIHRK